MKLKSLDNLINFAEKARNQKLQNYCNELILELNSKFKNSGGISNSTFSDVSGILVNGSIDNTIMNRVKDSVFSDNTGQQNIAFQSQNVKQSNTKNISINLTKTIQENKHLSQQEKEDIIDIVSKIQLEKNPEKSIGLYSKLMNKIKNHLDIAVAVKELLPAIIGLI